jgi:hypothetical protein
MIKRTKRTWRNMIKEKAICAANFMLSAYPLIILDTLLLSAYPLIMLDTLLLSAYPLIMLDTLLVELSLHFTTHHYTFRYLTSSHLNFTQLHFTTLSFVLTPFKFPTAPFHRTSLHFTSLHFTALLDDFHHTYMIFTVLIFLSFHPVSIPFISRKQGTWHVMFKNYIFILFIVCENPALIFGFMVCFFPLQSLVQVELNCLCNVVWIFYCHS